MGQFIPVLCDTRGCNTVWFNPSLFAIGPGASVTLSRITVAPCPKCGGSGHIPDGIYRHSSAELFNGSELEIVVRALTFLRRKAAAGATTDEIRREIKSRFPFLKGIKNFLPKDGAALVAYLTLILGIMTYQSIKSPVEQPQQVQALKAISEAIERVHADLKTNLQRTQAPRKHSSKRRRPKS